MLFRSDFYTSVSVGPVFGAILARQIEQIWRIWGEPDDFCVIEQGAHDAQLAADALAELKRLEHDFDYAILEDKPAFREAQRDRLGAKLTFHPKGLEEISQFSNAVFLCNELLDAFPVKRLRLTNGEWRELRVNSDFELQLSAAPISPGSALPHSIPICL